MNLLELYKNVCRKYYDSEANQDFNYDFTNPTSAISSFFTLAEKKNWIVVFDEINEMRSLHSFSLIYLGLIVKEKLDLDLSIKVGVESFPFCYYWSLLCLFHDLGYKYENDISSFYDLEIKNYSNYKQKNFYRKLNPSQIENVLYLNNEKYTRFSQTIRLILPYNSFSKPNGNIISNYLSKSQNFANKINQIKDVQININENISSISIQKNYFYKETINKYFKYIDDEFGHLDHGIIGGYLMFDRAIEQYRSMSYSEINVEGNPPFEFSHDFIFYSIEQIPLFAYLSDCIVSHNIFFADEKTKDVYKRYGMNELIDAKKISLYNNPILFLFDVLDAIDPIKCFGAETNNVEEILKSFDIEFEKNKIVINYSGENAKNDKMFEEYINRCLDMEKYLNIKVEFKKKSIELMLL